nr:kallikrein-8 isoform X1 [Peromyscus maniculatus bairdii]
MGRPPPCATQTWILLFLLMGAWAGLTRAQGSKVLEGQECAPHSQPWQTALFQGPRLVCGGVLVGDNWVLTAAHCKKQKYSVRLGDHSLQSRDEPEQEIQVAQSIQHPCYNSSNPEDHSHDVMLVRMRRSAKLGNKVKAINLTNECPRVGQKCTISGWGTVTSPRENFPDTLNCAQVEIFSQNKCERAYPGKVNEGMVCAGSSNGADTCQVRARLHLSFRRHSPPSGSVTGLGLAKSARLASKQAPGIHLCLPPQPWVLVFMLPTELSSQLPDSDISFSLGMGLFIVLSVK